MEQPFHVMGLWDPCPAAPITITTVDGTPALRMTAASDKQRAVLATERRLIATLGGHAHLRLVGPPSDDSLAVEATAAACQHVVPVLRRLGHTSVVPAERVTPRPTKTWWQDWATLPLRKASSAAAASEYLASGLAASAVPTTDGNRCFISPELRPSTEGRDAPPEAAVLWTYGAIAATLALKAQRPSQVDLLPAALEAEAGMDAALLAALEVRSLEAELTTSRGALLCVAAGCLREDPASRITADDARRLLETSPAPEDVLGAMEALRAAGVGETPPSPAPVPFRPTSPLGSPGETTPKAASGRPPRTPVSATPPSERPPERVSSPSPPQEEPGPPPEPRLQRRPSALASVLSTATKARNDAEMAKELRAALVRAQRRTWDSAEAKEEQEASRERLWRAFCDEFTLAPEAAAALTDPDAPPDTVVGAAGLTVLHAAAMCGDASLVEGLVGRGADPAHATEGGWALLHFAVWGGNVGLVTKCLDNGWGSLADRTLAGATVAHVACRSGSVDLLRYCCERGDAGLCALDIHGAGAVHYAALGGSVQCIRYAADNGGGSVADVDGDGATTVHYAARGGDLAALAFVTANGGDARAKTAAGQQPQDWGEAYGQADAVAFCVEYLG